MKFVTKENKITRAELKEMSEKMYQGIVKAVVDTERQSMVVDAGMHVDEEKELLDQGSQQEDLWGINFHPEKTGDEFVEFDSMINLRPSQGNRSRGVDDPERQTKIRSVIDSLVV